jgi:hypothetical protein
MRISDEIPSLIYELVDAHDDTARIAAQLVADPTWSVHLDYLRDLQRVARELLAAANRCEDTNGLCSRQPRRNGSNHSPHPGVL